MLKNPEVIQTAKENRARQLSTEAYETAYLEWYNDPKANKVKNQNKSITK